MNFQPIAHYDVHLLAASLVTRDGLWRDAPEPGRKLLQVRFPRAGTSDSEDTIAWAIGTNTTRRQWPELHNLIGRMKRDSEARIGAEIEMGRQYLEMLDRGARLEWHAEDGPYFERYARSLIPLRTNPHTLLIAGCEVASPGHGWLTWMNVRAPCAAINMGDCPLVMLVIDSRRKEKTDA